MAKDPSWEKAVRDQKAANRKQKRQSAGEWFLVVMVCVAAFIVTLVIWFMALLWIEKTQQEIQIGAKAMSEEKEEALAEKVTASIVVPPYFTWDGQTIPPTREYDPERDGPYPVVQVHNSQSPGLKKQGRLIRPVTKPDAEFPIWEVDIGGEVIVCHDPEEAWNQ